MDMDLLRCGCAACVQRCRDGLSLLRTGDVPRIWAPTPSRVYETQNTEGTSWREKAGGQDSTPGNSQGDGRAEPNILLKREEINRIRYFRRSGGTTGQENGPGGGRYENLCRCNPTVCRCGVPYDIHKKSRGDRKTHSPNAATASTREDDPSIYTLGADWDRQDSPSYETLPGHLYCYSWP